MEIQFRKDLPILLQYCNLDKYPVAEIGVGTGRFARELLGGGLNLFLIDIWAKVEGGIQDLAEPQKWHDANYQKTLGNLNGFTEHEDYTILRMLSADAAKEFKEGVLGAVYIDSTHDYDSVMADLRAWYPKVIKGGIIAGHDYLNPAFGVTEAVTEFAKEIGAEVHAIIDTPDVGSSFWFIKPE